VKEWCRCIKLSSRKDERKSIKEEYNHLFSTPIDAAFTRSPFVFWEITSMEINQYATKEYKINYGIYVGSDSK
jgi:hypothetical protein